MSKPSRLAWRLLARASPCINPDSFCPPSVEPRPLRLQAAAARRVFFRQLILVKRGGSGVWV